jgi:hypothetical protein
MADKEKLESLYNRKSILEKIIKLEENKHPIKPDTVKKTDSIIEGEEIPSIPSPKPIEPEPESDFEFEGEVFAFIVGINKYKFGVDVPVNSSVKLGSKNFTNLNCCENDAKIFRDFLIKHNVKEENIDFLLDDQQIKTEEDRITQRKNIFLKLKNLSKKVNNLQDDPLVFIFFSCHGYDDGDEVYLIPWDGERDNLDGTAILHRDIHERLKSFKTKRLVVLIDSCHSGDFITSGQKGNFKHDQILNLGRGEDYKIIASCKSDQNSSEEKQNGIFTYELISLLNNNYNEIKKPFITTTNLYQILKQKISNKTSNKQEPTSNFTDDEEGILIGKNTKRFEEYKKKQNNLLNKINGSIGDQIFDFLKNYISGKRYFKDYKNLYDKFDAYLGIENLYGNCLLNFISTLEDVFNECQKSESKKSEQKPESFINKKDSFHKETSININKTTGSIFLYKNPGFHNLNEDQKNALLSLLVDNTNSWRKLNFHLQNPVSKNSLLKLIDEIFKEFRESNIIIDENKFGNDFDKIWNSIIKENSEKDNENRVNNLNSSSFLNIRNW